MGVSWSGHRTSKPTGSIRTGLGLALSKAAYAAPLGSDRLPRVLPHRERPSDPRPRRRLPPSKAGRLAAQAQELAHALGHQLGLWEREEVNRGRFAFCVRCKLAAGVDPDPDDPEDIMFGSAIQVQCGGPPSWT
jgi:hypothetical protein